MPVLNRIASYAEEMKGWRHHLHQHPELAFECHETAAWIVSGCARWGWTRSMRGLRRPESWH